MPISLCEFGTREKWKGLRERRHLCRPLASAIRRWSTILGLDELWAQNIFIIIGPWPGREGAICPSGNQFGQTWLQGPSQDPSDPGLALTRPAQKWPFLTIFDRKWSNFDQFFGHFLIKKWSKNRQNWVIFWPNFNQDRLLTDSPPDQEMVLPPQVTNLYRLPETDPFQGPPKGRPSLVRALKFSLRKIEEKPTFWPSELTAKKCSLGHENPRKIADFPGPKCQNPGHLHTFSQKVTFSWNPAV